MKLPFSFKRAAVKTLLWISGILVSLMVLVQILLSPAVLEPVIERFAAYWLDCDVSFGRVGVNVFRNFPNISLTVDDCLVRYDAQRFAEYTREVESGSPSRAGTYLGMYRSREECDTADLCGRYDTLAVMSSLRATVNPFALACRQLRIKQISVTDLKGFAHRFDTAQANWNIVRHIMNADTVEKKDTSSFRMPRPVIGRITLDGHPQVVFTDRFNDISLLVALESLDFKGNRASGKSLVHSFRLKMDSVLVVNSHSGSTAAVSVGKLRLHSAGDYGMEGSVTASMFLSDAIYGRMEFPVDMHLNVDVFQDTVPQVCVRELAGKICGLPFSVGGSVSLPEDSVWVDDATFDICAGRIGELLGEYGPAFSKILGDIRTDALLNVHAGMDGWLVPSEGRLPEFSVDVTVPESALRYKEEDMADFSLKCSASGGGDKHMAAVLEELAISSDGDTHINASGRVDDLSGGDPMVSITASAEADLAGWSDLLGSDTTFRFSGHLSADMDGKMRMSQMNFRNYSRADLNAGLLLSGVKFVMPSDSIDVSADTLIFRTGARKNTEFDEIVRGARVMVSSLSVDTAFVRIGRGMEVSLKDLSCNGHSDGTLLSDTSGRISFHPYYLQVAAHRLSLMDSDSTRIVLRNTDNVLKLSYRPDNDTIPVVDLTSRTKMAALRTREALTGIRGLNLDFRAEKGRVLARPAGSDSVVRRHRDSTVTAVPSESDLNFSLGETFGKLYRQWSAGGGVSFRSAVIRSPKFPLKTSVNDMNLAFSSNKFTLHSLNVRAGNTSMDLSGNITGVRRAVLRNGTIKVELSMDSPGIDVNELLAAVAVGSENTSQTIFHEEDNAMSSALDAPDDGDITQQAADISSSLLMLPGNVDAVCRLSGHSISVSNMVVDSLSTILEMRKGCLRVSEITAMTNIGNLSFEGFYATPSRNDVSVGMDLELTGVTAADVLDMVPGIDSLMPMLSSFNGRLKCQVAGTTHLDTNMRIIPPTAMGVLRIGGDSLHLDQTPSLKKITRLLMFKDKSALNIKTMSVDAQMHDSQLEVFPFILDIDRYKVAASGRMGFEGSCSYHISILKSPLPFKLGLDIAGDDYNHLKFRVVRPKYRDEEKIPAFSVTVDRTRKELSKMISDIFVRGVDRMMSDEELFKAVEEKKRDISYTAAEEQRSEVIPQAELDKMREAGADKE